LIYRVGSLDVVTMIDLSKKIESKYEIIAFSSYSILLIILIFVGTYVKLTKHLGTLFTTFCLSTNQTPFNKFIFVFKVLLRFQYLRVGSQIPTFS